MNRRANPLFTIIVVVGGLAVAAGAIYLTAIAANRFLARPGATKASAAAEAAAACKVGNHTNYKAVIENNLVTPANTAGALCDTLTITNLDDIQRLMAFGPHENHLAYDGITERSLIINQSFTLTFVQAGTFRFHDHENDAVSGTFTVSQ